MSSTPSKPLLNWLQHHSDHLNVLLAQVHLLRRITHMIRHALPEPLASHCHAANMDGDTLVMGCDSSAWAAKLRFEIPQLLRQLNDQQGFPAFSQIRVRVQPLDKERSRTANRRLRLSDHNATLITSFADNTADPKLKAALHRLSQRAKSDKKP